MSRFGCILTLITGIAPALTAPAVVCAADMPSRKSGLWEIKTEAGTGGKLMPWGTIRMCIVQSQDDMIYGQNDTTNLRKRCSRIEVKRLGNRITIDSVCEANGHTSTSRTEITGNLTTYFRMEGTASISPPVNGIQSMASRARGKWLGACKPGQRHGSATVTGMPGMKPGEAFKVN